MIHEVCCIPCEAQVHLSVLLRYFVSALDEGLHGILRYLCVYKYVTLLNTLPKFFLLRKNI